MVLGTPLDPSSPQARAISDLFGSTLIVCAIIFAIVAVLITMAIMRFRDSAGKKKANQTEGHTRLEIAWTIAPLLVLAGIFYLTINAVNGSDPPPDRDPDITIIAHQWWWEARYKSGAVTANEIHIPVGKALVVGIESADVIHDFWVPDLARKIDAVPGRKSTIWMQADSPGTYVGACAEYCGVQHAWMRILVVADKPEDFDAWEKHTKEPAPARTQAQTPAQMSAAHGAQLFAQMTCVKCHSIGGMTNTVSGVSADAPRAAPDLTHLAMRTTLGAGVIKNSPSELSRWLKNPQDVKPGCHMPDVQLSDQDVADFVAYFETLQ